MKRLLTLIIIAFNLLAAPESSIGAEYDADHYINVIDTLLAHQQDFEAAKLARISSVKQQLSKARTPEERYKLNDRLVEEYASYRVDSALKYIDRGLELARRAHNADWEAHTRLQKAVQLTGAGLLNESMKMLEGINPKNLDKDRLADYYGEMIYLYGHLGNYSGSSPNSYEAKRRNYADSIVALITPDHKDYFWYKGWQEIGKHAVDPATIKALKAKVDSSPLDSRDEAKNAYMLYRLYNQAGDKENAKKYLAMSAISDIKTANAEIASMKELSEILFDEKDIDRAYQYINYSIAQAKAFPSRVRMIENIEPLDNINRAYQAKAKKEEYRQRVFGILMGVFATLLLATGLIIAWQNRQLKRQSRIVDEANTDMKKHMEELSDAEAKLADVNVRLHELNESLKRKNDELNESNYVKEEYIGYVFNLFSDNIRKLDDLQKSIHTKAVAGKLKEIEKQTANANMMKDELKEFYRSFDNVFLHIYPDFVKDFNSLLEDDKHIVVKEGELLNTELRIYALVRLGITDSVRIAQFLHCSPQTVYNNRFRVRGKAKVSKETFAEKVRVLGVIEKRRGEG